MSVFSVHPSVESSAHSFDRPSCEELLENSTTLVNNHMQTRTGCFLTLPMIWNACMYKGECFPFAYTYIYSQSYKSIERFNILIQLEAEYSSLGRNLKHAFESFSKASASAEDDLKAMLEQHDRSFFVGKMPKSLFAERFMQ